MKRSRTTALNRIVGSSLIFSVIAVNRGPLPAAARSPVSLSVIRPVRGSTVIITTSSAQRWMRRAGDPTSEGNKYANQEEQDTTNVQ